MYGWLWGQAISIETCTTIAKKRTTKTYKEAAKGKDIGPNKTDLGQRAFEARYLLSQGTSERKH